MSGIMLVALSVLLSAAASYFLKLGAMSVAGRGILALAVHPMALLGLACYGATFGMYALALQKVPLSLAQPVITGGATVITAALSVLLLKESLSLANWLGLLLVCVGIYFLFVGRA